MKTSKKKKKTPCCTKIEVEYWERGPLDVFLLRKEAFENAFFAEDVALLATQGVDEGFETEWTSIEGLDRVLAEPLALRAVP